MSKIRLIYSSPISITFNGVEEFEDIDLPDGWEEYTVEEKREFLTDIEEEWLWENIHVMAEVIDE